MDQEDEYGGLFLVSVDDLGAPGLWATTKSLLESRSTLHNLVLHNKLGRAVTVDRLALQFVASGDKRLQRLRPFAHSPVVWFRLPFAHLLLVSTLDTSEYRNVLKPALKRAIADLEHDWGGPTATGPPPPQPSGMGVLLGGSGAAAAPPMGMLGAEWLIVYVRPLEADMGDKAAKKMYDKIKDDFSSRSRTRVIRIDPPKGYSAAAVAAMGGGGVSWAAPRGGGAAAGVAGGFFPSTVVGLEDLELCLRECVRSSFESRQAAYMAEVQRLANERRDPNWSFASLYLVKDSLALLLEGCGLHLEAYKEYVELEAAYQETLNRQQQQQHGTADASGQMGASAPWDFQDDRFGASGDGAEVASLTSASWRVTRRSVLKRAAVQEFRFRQYLFASQSRLLLRLGRPVDVAERGLRFIGALAAELGQREQPPTGSVRPLFKEAWTVSACLAVVAAVTASVFGRETSPVPPPLLTGSGVGLGPGGGVGVGGVGGHSHASSWDVSGSAAAGEPAGARASRTVNGTEAGGSKSVFSHPGSQQPESALRASSTLLDEDASVAGVDLAGGRPEAAAAAAAATAGRVDWQLWVPFEAEVPSLDPMALCGQVIAPATLASSRPADAETLLRQATFQSFILALAHLYSSALSALLKLAQRAAQMVHAPSPSPSPPPAPSPQPRDSAAPADDAGVGRKAQGTTEATEVAFADDWCTLLAAWRHGLSEVPAQYACRAVVGMFVDQEEDRQFEATPQQQATQLQLLRQAISGLVAGAGVGMASGVAAAPPSPLRSQGNTGTPRGEGSPAASSGVWLTPTGGVAVSLPELPQQGFRNNRSESLYSVSIAGGPVVAGPTGPGAPGVSADIWDAVLQTAAGAGTAATSAASRHAMSSGMGVPGGRTQTSCAADSELLASSATALVADGRLLGGPQRKPHHQHSPSADGFSGLFFTKLDVFASKMSSALDPLRPQRPTGHHGPGLPSPAAVDDRAANPLLSGKLPVSREPQLQSEPSVSGVDLGLAAGGELAPPSLTGLILPAEISWLRDWRVRLALSSPSYCGDLALQLALAAATCYSRAGRQRAAAQMYGDVGAILLGRDQSEVVAELMEHVISLAQAEGWYAVMSRALPIMMSAQQAIGHVMLPYTCVKYLSLPPLACHTDVRRRVLEHVLSSAGCSLGPDGSSKVRRPLLPSAVLQLSTGQAVQAALLPGWSSKFYGTHCASGVPSLVPPARPAARPSWFRHIHDGGDDGTDKEACGGGGDDGNRGSGRRRQRQRQRCSGGGAAQYLRVGDVCFLELQVYSNLPIAVSLSDLHLVLGTLQPTQPPPPHSGPSNHHNHHSHPVRQSHSGQQKLQIHPPQQPGHAQSMSMTQIATQTLPATQTWSHSLSGTTGQAPPQPPPPHRPHASSFSLVQSSNDHARNPSGADLYVESGGVHGFAPALRVKSNSMIAGSSGTAAAAPFPQPPPSAAIATGGPSLHQRQTVTDLVGAHPQAASLEDWAITTSQPPYHQQHLQHVHLHPHQASTGPLARVSASGLSYPTASAGGPSWGSAASSQQQLPLLPNSPTMAVGGGNGTAAAAAASGPSRLVNASRGLERNAYSNASSSLSLGPTHLGGGGGGGSYSNLSEASGLWRRAPSWADTLSAAASLPPGVAGSGMFGATTCKAGQLLDVPAIGGAGAGGGGGLMSPSSTRGGIGPGWAAADDLACHHLVKVRNVQGPQKFGRSSGGGAESAPTSSSTAPSDSRSVVLQPGLTRLVFRVAPTRPGLYFARHLSASLGSYDVRIPVVPAAQLAADVRALTGGWPGFIGLGASSSGPRGLSVPGAGGSFTFGGLGLGGAALGTAAAIALLGEVADGEVRHLEVALQVAPLVPRLLVGPVVVGGALAAGLPQWLGVALAPLDPEPSGSGGRSSVSGGGGSDSEDNGNGSGSGSGKAGGRGGGLQHVRVHVQARAQSTLRLGEWFPCPPASTPMGPLTALPSMASVGGGLPAMSGPPSSTTPAAATATEPLSGDSAAGAFTAPAASSFASPAVAAAAAAAMAATPSFHHPHHPHQSAIMSAPPTYRRAEGSGQCRVAVIDLRRAAANSWRQETVAAAAAASGGSAPPPPLSRGPSQSSRMPRLSVPAEGAPALPGVGASGSSVGTAAASGRGALTAGVAEAHWTVSSRQGIDLSQALGGSLCSPVLLWVPVWVPPAAPVVGSDDKAPPLDVAPELVRVQQAHGGVTSSRYGASGGLITRRTTTRPGGVNMSLNGREGVSASQHLLSQPQGQKNSLLLGQRPLPPLELEVVVEGLRGGMWRSHATSLSVPLQQPFRVRTTAHQLPDTHVLVSVTVTSCLALPILITEVVLEPQYGLMLGTNPTADAGDAPGSAVGGHLPSVVPGLLPLQLAPHEAANWGFMLSRSAEALQALPGLHQDDCCLLHMAFCVVPPATSGPGSLPEACEVLGPALQPVSGLRYPLPPLPAPAPWSVPGDGYLTPFMSLTESVALASSPGGVAIGHAHGHGHGSTLLPLPPTLLQNSNKAVAAMAAASCGQSPLIAPPAVPVQLTASGGSCPNIYSHSGLYALSVAPRSFDGLGAGGAAGTVASAAAATATAAGFSFTHGFILEFPPSNALTHNLVSVRLLGPQSAVQGQPTHLTWLVTRISSPPPTAVHGGGSITAIAVDDAADIAVYEVSEAADAADGGSVTLPGSAVAIAAAAAGSATSCGAAAAAGGGQWQWRQALGCRGSIHLGRAKGSVAVVEAVVLPVMPGLLRAPVLKLRGLREVREEDAGTAEYVVVSPSTVC